MQENFWATFGVLSAKTWIEIAQNPKYFEIIIIALSKKQKRSAKTFYRFLLEHTDVYLQDPRGWELFEVKITLFSTKFL